MPLNIGGFQKNSFIDYPGMVACVVFTDGCNFRCPYCHNPELVCGGSHSRTSRIREDQVFEYLDKRKGLLDGVVISGGEPTLQDALQPFCAKIKALGFKLKLDTNGSRPEMIASLFDLGLIDYCAMDIKSNPEGYTHLAWGTFDPSLIDRSIRIIIKKAPAYEFRTTCVKPFLDKSIISDIGKKIKGPGNYILQQCSGKSTMLDPGFLNREGMIFSSLEMKELKTEVESHGIACSLR